MDLRKDNNIRPENLRVVTYSIQHIDYGSFKTTFDVKFELSVSGPGRIRRSQKFQRRDLFQDVFVEQGVKTSPWKEILHMFHDLKHPQCTDARTCGLVEHFKEHTFTPFCWLKARKMTNYTAVSDRPHGKCSFEDLDVYGVYLQWSGLCHPQ